MFKPNDSIWKSMFLKTLMVFFMKKKSQPLVLWDPKGLDNTSLAAKAAVTLPPFSATEKNHLQLKSKNYSSTDLIFFLLVKRNIKWK